MTAAVCTLGILAARVQLRVHEIISCTRPGRASSGSPRRLEQRSKRLSQGICGQGTINWQGC